MVMANPPNHERSLHRVMVLGTALSFGILAAIVVSMQDFVAGKVSFHFTYKTVLGFVGGFVVGWLFWLLIDKLIRKGQ